MENHLELTDQRINELNGIAKEVRDHRKEWEGYLNNPSTLISELTGEAKELEDIFDVLEGVSYMDDSLYETFNTVFMTYIVEHPENALLSIELFKRMSILLRKLLNKTEIISRQSVYYNHLYEQSRELELSGKSHDYKMKSA